MSGISKLDSAEDNLHELVLSGPDVEQHISDQNGAFPVKIFTLTELNFLEIRHTSLAGVPDPIGQLTGLTQLVLSHNQIKSVSKEIMKLDKLKLLNLENNKIEELDENMFNSNTFPSLLTLNLSHNQLQRMPTMKLPCILELNVSHNQFEQFPVDCNEGELPNFMTLRAKGNRIQSIPPEIADAIPSLKCLDLSENEITQIPGELGNCGRLKELILSANPIKDRRLLKMACDSHVKVATILDYLLEQFKKAGGGKKNVKNKKRDRKDSNAENAKNRVIIIPESPEIQGQFLSTSGGRLVRPHLVVCIIRGIKFENLTELKKFIALQNRLHDCDTLCGKRLNATIATHDLDKIELPVTLSALNPDQLEIVPLKCEKLESGKQLVGRLREEADLVRKKEKRSTYSGIYKYLNLVQHLEQYACLIDKTGQVISFPPITNCDTTRVAPETVSVLVEVSSGQSQAICKKVAENLILETLKLAFKTDESIAEPVEGSVLVIEQVKVLADDGTVHTTFPDRHDLLNCGADVQVIRK